jgi:CubicO group peptidase (beta-lactamase class C family)
MDTRTVKILLLCIVTFTALCAMATASPWSRPEEYWPTRSWRLSSPEAQGMDSGALADAFGYIRQRQIPIHSLLIVRNGYLVLDAYFWPFQDHQLHDLASVTKSVTSTLVGIAIAQHKLDGVKQPLLLVFDRKGIANRDPRKDRVTLEHLLTMTSGLDCRFDRGEITLSQMMASSDWVQFMLNRKMVAEPGSHYEYCSPGMHLLSGVIARATGTIGSAYAGRELFLPLGIDELAWPADRQGNEYGWGDLHLQPRDMAKIGHLWLKGGRWEERQIVAVDWMRAAVQVHSHPGFSRGQEYGYSFWLYPERNPPVFEGLGRGGQRISVVPGANLVVVFTGGGFEPGDIGNFIGRALKSSEPLPEDPVASARLDAAVRGATRPPPAGQTPSLPALAKVISGRTYVLNANPIGIKSLSLSFPGGAEALIRLKLRDRTDGPRPAGLDNVPRISPNGRFGLPVAVRGAWESDSIFTLDYDEVGNINSYRIRLTFSGRRVNAEITERTGLANARTSGTTGK